MQERRFLFITSFLIALIGAPAVYSVVREPDLIATSREGQSPTVDAQRSPASIQEKASDFEGTRRNAIKSKSVVLEYKCLDEKLEVDGSLVRLKGSSCLDEKWQDISIVNHSNGFTASVIFLKNKSFTTDFIDLNEGENKLSIQAKDEKGQAVQKSLIVTRLPRAPASVETEE